MERGAKVWGLGGIKRVGDGRWGAARRRLTYEEDSNCCGYYRDFGVGRAEMEKCTGGIRQVHQVEPAIRTHPDTEVHLPVAGRHPGREAGGRRLLEGRFGRLGRGDFCAFRQAGR